MYDDTLGKVGDAAEAKAKLVSTGLSAYLVHAAMAGAYVGLAIVLIFTFGTPLDAAGSPYTNLVMAATFGIALCLVLAAGSDLFTGNTMIMGVGAFRDRTNWRDLLRVWSWSWLGNLAGSALVAGLAAGAGIFATDPSLVVSVAEQKTTAPMSELFLRGILCNWLVVLAVWCWFKIDDEMARLVMVWWCLLAFIGSGYEHSVANMTLLTLGNLLSSTDAVTWSGMAYNLIPVTLGNVVSGFLFMGGAYWYVEDAPVEGPSKTTTGPTHADD